MLDFLSLGAHEIFISLGKKCSLSLGAYSIILLLGIRCNVYVSLGVCTFTCSVFELQVQECFFLKTETLQCYLYVQKMFPDPTVLQYTVLYVVCFLHNENITYLKLVQCAHNISYTTCNYEQYFTFLQCCSVLSRPSSNGIPYILNLFSLQKQVIGKWLLRGSWVAMCGVEFLRNLSCISGDCSILPQLFIKVMCYKSGQDDTGDDSSGIFLKSYALWDSYGIGEEDQTVNLFRLHLSSRTTFGIGFALSYPPWP